MKLCCCALSLVTICLILDECSGRTSEELRVTLPNGSKLVGRHLRSHDGKGIRAFMGIPYAEPPVGDLRFRNYGGYTPTQYLSYANMTFIKNEECDSVAMKYGVTMYPATICAMGNVKDMGIFCNNAANGIPLSSPGSRVLLGLKTYYSSCSGESLSTFTGVSYYADWIAENTEIFGVDTI